MRILSVLLALGLQALPGQTLTRAERDRARAELEASRELLRKTVAGLSEAQWRFKPAPERWSIAECLEHIALAEDGYFQTLGKLLKTAGDAAKRAEVAGKDELVLKAMPDRSSKRVTGEALEPKARWARPADALAFFDQSRDRLVRYVNATQDPLRDRFQAHRAVGLIDGYQWILLASGHVRRHVEQMDEVKAAPGYPQR